MRIAMDFVAPTVHKPVTLYIRDPEGSSKDTRWMKEEGQRMWDALDASFDQMLAEGEGNTRGDGFRSESEKRRFEEKKARVWIVLHRQGFWTVKCDIARVEQMRVAQRNFVRRVVWRLGTDERGIFRFDDESIRKWAEEGVEK